ncbi:MAG: ABCB family ABC transporter ATP-binding protein/permease [bacterium]
MALRFRVHTTRAGNWSPVARLWPHLWRYRRRVAAGLLFLVLARLANISVPLILKRIVDALDAAPAHALLVAPLALLAGYGALRFGAILFNELRNVVFSRASVQIIHNISVEVFRHLHRLSLGFHLDRKTGALSRDVERGTSAVTGFLRMFVFSIIPVVFELCAVLLILGARFDASFVLITLTMIVIYGVFTVGVTTWRTKFRVQMNQAESGANTRAVDALLNFETVKVFGNERAEIERYGDSLGGWVDASQRSNLSLAFLNVGQGAIVAVGLTALMILAARGVVGGEMTLGDFVMVNAFLIQLYIPLNFMGSIYRDINHALIDMERMFALLDEVPEVAERADAPPLRLARGEIRFERVHFRYLDDRAVLRDIDFRVRGGEMMAVVGPSGSGKSTISRLLLRFYDPDEGCIRIDGQDIRGVTLSSLRAALGVVPQDTVLFNETIGYNINYGRLGADQRQVEAAAKIARLDEFIAQHPQGYDILVGERGLKLSGGEKQRVAIARAALKGAPILIFDEATSSLDSRSEKAIQEALARVARDSTTVVIAHRLSTIVNADQIIVLDQGRIVEQGTHDQLLARRGLYAQMWQLQEDAAAE